MREKKIDELAQEPTSQSDEDKKVKRRLSLDEWKERFIRLESELKNIASLME